MPGSNVPSRSAHCCCHFVARSAKKRNRWHLADVTKMFDINRRRIPDTAVTTRIFDRVEQGGCHGLRGVDRLNLPLHVSRIKCIHTLLPLVGIGFALQC